MAVKGTVRSALSLEVLGSRRNMAGKVPLPEYPIGPVQEEGLDGVVMSIPPEYMMGQLQAHGVVAYI